MTILIDKKLLAQQVIDNLSIIQAEAKGYNEQLLELQEKLALVQNFPDFHLIVQQIIETEKEVHNFLLKHMCGLDQDVMDIVNAYLSKHDSFFVVKNVVDFYKIVSERIIATKERLSEDELSNLLTPEKRIVFKEFIARIKELKPMMDVFNHQKITFKKRLEDADSLDDINHIEHDIESQNDAFSMVFSKVIQYPEDEDIAGALINYLESNPQLLAVMESFNLHESLMDDILGARARQLNHSRP